MKKLIVILFLSFASLNLNAQYFDISKIIFDNVKFEHPALNNFYTQNYNLTSKELFLKQLLSEIEKDNTSLKNERDKCYYYIFKSLNFFSTNNRVDATKNYIKARQIAEKINDESLRNNCHILASIIFIQTKAYNLAIDELSKCKNLKDVEAFQVLYTKILMHEITKDNVGINKTISTLNSISEKISNYDYLCFLKKCTSIYIYDLKDYETGLKYIERTDSLLKNFSNGLLLSTQILYKEHPNLTDDKLLFERILCLTNEGICYRLLRNLTKSENKLLEAIELTKSYKGSDHIDFLYVNFGLTYTILRKYEMAKNYYQIALNNYLAKKNNSEIAETYNLIAKNELLRTELEAAANACMQSIKIAEANLDYKNLAASYFILTEIYQVNHDYLNAQKNFKMFSYYAEQNTKSISENINSNLKTDADAALEITSVERDISEKEKNELEILRIKLESEQREQELLLLRKGQELSEKTIQAEQLEKDRALKTLALIQQELERENLKKNYDRIQKDRAIEGLENEKNKNKIILLNNQKTLYEKENVLKNLEIKRDREQKKYLTIGFFAICVVFIIFALFAYRTYKQRRIIQKNNIELEKISRNLKLTNSKLEENVNEINKQKQIIETKNFQIVESINYALRIQEALLFQEIDLNKIFKSHFIYSKPKDIVSGDFLVVLKKRNKIYVAVADCTGHGVPGALLSIIGHTEISHFVEFYNYTPATILEKLNEKFNELLNLSGQFGTDGMDVMLVEIDIITKVITFAGARSYLLVYDNNELKEFKGDRISIGEFSDEAINFNNQQISISEHAKIFLYTDGYQDQQCEKTKKRIGSKLFKQTILETIETPFEEQRKKLDTIFIEQSGNLKQTDDITILGLQPSFITISNDIKNENPKIRELLSIISNHQFNLNNIIIIHGSMNQELVISTINLLGIKLSNKNFDRNLVNKIKVVSLETLQNITKHQFLNSEYLPYFILNESDHKIDIYSGNIVKNKDRELLIEKLNIYKTIDIGELKEIYAKTLEKAELSENGNAGLGLLTLALKSNQQFDFDFIKINDLFYHFNLQLTII